jgi:LysM repeat protein
MKRMTKKYNPFQHQQSQGYEIASADTSQNDLGSNQDRLSDIQSGTYTVRNGDSFWSIANQLNITIPSLLAVNGLNMNDVIHPGTELKIPGLSSHSNNQQTSEHTVSSGDSLWDIADKYNVSFSDLLAANQMNQWTTIYPGMKITIPNGGSASSGQSSAPAEYTVGNGDSLWGIANKFGVSISALENANNLFNATIHPGQVLKIPTTSSARSTETSQSTAHHEEHKQSNSQNGYDPVLGKELARASMAESGGRTWAGGMCYSGVANAVDQVIGRFLTGLHAYMAASQLAQRKDLFTEIPSGNLRSLPAGAIVVWGKGTSKSGHISIAQGNGMETSDFIGNQMTYHYGGAAARVFLPKGRM